MKVTRSLGKYEIDFDMDLILTKYTETVMQGRDLRDFKMINIVRVPMANFKARLKATLTVLKFIWSE
jgi:hypothetical protein